MNYIELAKQVGAVQNVLAMGRHDGVLFTETELEKFAALVAAHEREACAQAAERIKRFYTVSSFNDQKARCANEIKTSILKRGEA